MAELELAALALLGLLWLAGALIRARRWRRLFDELDHIAWLLETELERPIEPPAEPPT